MQTSPRLKIQYPDTTNELDSADVPRDIYSLVQWLDLAGIINTGLLANRPVSTPGSPGTIGRFYLSTDAGTITFDTGTSWVQLYPEQQTLQSLGGIGMAMLIALG